MAARLYLYNFCKRRQFASPKTIDLVPSGVTMATGLGCNIPISTSDGDALSVLRTVQRDTGTEKQQLLTVTDGTSYADPGPTTWMTGVRSALLSSPVTLPYPTSRISTDYTVSFDGIDYLVDQNGIGFDPDVPSILRLGFSGDLGFVRTVSCQAKEYITQDKVKALHLTNHYARYPSVTTNGDALSLSYNESSLKYEWPTAYTLGSLQQRTRTVSVSGTSNWFYSIRVFIWGVNPARIGHSGSNFKPDETNGNGHGVDGNGPSQDRRISYTEIDSIIAPDYGGSMDGSANISGFRPGVVLYTDEAVTASRHAEMFINGTQVISAVATVPTPQKSDSQDTLLNASYEAIFTMAPRNIGTFTITVQTPKHLEIGDDFEEQVGVITFNDPIPGLWYEGLIYFHQGNFDA